MLVTVLAGALFGATAARFDDSWLLPAYLVLTGALVALAVIDFETYLLPNRIVYPLTVGDAGAARAGRGRSTATSTTTCAACSPASIAFAIFFVLHLVSPRSMGFGDVKLVVHPRASRSACSAGARWCSACSSGSSTAR